MSHRLNPVEMSIWLLYGSITEMYLLDSLCSRISTTRTNVIITRIRKIVAIVKNSMLHLYYNKYRFTFSFIHSKQILAKYYYYDQNVLRQKMTSSMFKAGKGHMKTFTMTTLVWNQNARGAWKCTFSCASKKRFCAHPKTQAGWPKRLALIRATLLTKFAIIGVSLW